MPLLRPLDPAFPIERQPPGVSAPHSRGGWNGNFVVKWPAGPATVLPLPKREAGTPKRCSGRKGGITLLDMRAVSNTGASPRSSLPAAPMAHRKIHT